MQYSFLANVKDVIRTIRIDERYRQIMSKGDPFGGHHYACMPLAWSPDARFVIFSVLSFRFRSYGHIHPQPLHMDLGEYAPSELVYDMDADGTEGIWDSG